MWYFRSVVSAAHHRLFASVLVFLLLAGFGRIQAATGVLATWDPPADGQSVAQYELFYGTQSGVYTNSLAVFNNAYAVITGLPGNNTYYFAVLAIDTNGVSSPLSAEASVTLTVPLPVNLQTQVYTDGNGVPYAMTITGTINVSTDWELDSSPDLVNWSYVTEDHGTDVYWAAYFSDAPRMFFRVVPQH
jgi:hypothetical protein